MLNIKLQLNHWRGFPKPSDSGCAIWSTTFEIFLRFATERQPAGFSSRQLVRKIPVQQFFDGEQDDGALFLFPETRDFPLGVLAVIE